MIILCSNYFLCFCSDLLDSVLCSLLCKCIFKALNPNTKMFHSFSAILLHTYSLTSAFLSIFFKNMLFIVFKLMWIKAFEVRQQDMNWISLYISYVYIYVHIYTQHILITYIIYYIYIWVGYHIHDYTIIIHINLNIALIKLFHWFHN